MNYPKSKTTDHSINYENESIHYKYSKKYSILFYFKLLIILLILNTIFFLFLTRQGASLEEGNDSPILNEVSIDKIILPIQTKNDNHNNQISTIQVNNCYLWEFSSDTDLKRAKATLSNPMWSDFSSELAKAPAIFMVFLGPFINSSQLNDTAKQLKDLKIKDYNILPSNEISLSVVNTREAAIAFKQSLIVRGLQKIDIRALDNNKQRLRYRFNKLDIEYQQALIKTAGTLRQCDAIK